MARSTHPPIALRPPRGVSAPQDCRVQQGDSPIPEASSNGMLVKAWDAPRATGRPPNHRAPRLTPCHPLYILDFSVIPCPYMISDLAIFPRIFIEFAGQIRGHTISAFMGRVRAAERNDLA